MGAAGSGVLVRVPLDAGDPRLALGRLRLVGAAGAHGLVAHSLLAMAGFTTNLLLLLAAVLLGRDGDALDSRWAFWAWQGCAFLYVCVMLAAGWVEGRQPGFTMAAGPLRDGLYTARLLLGAGMAAASVNWLLRLPGRVRAAA